MHTNLLTHFIWSTATCTEWTRNCIKAYMGGFWADPLHQPYCRSFARVESWSYESGWRLFQVKYVMISMVVYLPSSLAHQGRDKIRQSFFGGEEKRQMVDVIWLHGQFVTWKSLEGLILNPLDGLWACNGYVLPKRNLTNLGLLSLSKVHASVKAFCDSDQLPWLLM